MSKQYYTPDNYSVHTSVGYLIKRSWALILDSLEPKLAERGFSHIQFSVLMSLRENIAVTPSIICSIYRHDSGALTRVLDQLEERGLIERRRSREDRRTIELHLTPAGRKAADDLVPMITEELNSGLHALSYEEIVELVRLLQKLLGSLQHPAGQPAAGDLA
jgi:DNA-binding MarR family transcriptional regulator